MLSLTAKGMPQRDIRRIEGRQLRRCRLGILDRKQRNENSGSSAAVSAAYTRSRSRKDRGHFHTQHGARQISKRHWHLRIPSFSEGACGAAESARVCRHCLARSSPLRSHRSTMHPPFITMTRSNGAGPHADRATRRDNSCRAALSDRRADWHHRLHGYIERRCRFVQNQQLR